MTDCPSIQSKSSHLQTAWRRAIALDHHRSRPSSKGTVNPMKVANIRQEKGKCAYEDTLFNLFRSFHWETELLMEIDSKFRSEMEIKSKQLKDRQRESEETDPKIRASKEFEMSEAKKKAEIETNRGLKQAELEVEEKRTTI